MRGDATPRAQMGEALGGARLPSLPAASSGPSGRSTFFGKEARAFALTRLAADDALAPAKLALNSGAEADAALHMFDAESL